MTLRIGDPAPDFTATSSTGETISRGDFSGRALVLFFFPRAETLLCTREACGFRDTYRELRETGAAVVGVSGDPPEALRGFADRHGLPFPLVSDADGSLRERFGVSRLWGILDARVTFVIDPAGEIRHVTQARFSAERHVREAREAVERIRRGRG